MRNKITLLLLILVTSLQSKIFAQKSEHNKHACKASSQNELIFKKHPKARKEYLEFNKTTKQLARNKKSQRARTYTIPVVFHVYGENQNGKTITVDKIQTALEKLNLDFQGLNDDFAGVDPLFDPIKSSLDIEFKLAKLDPNGNCTSGVVFYDEKNGYGNGGGYDNQIAADAWDNYKYMNVYIQAELYADGDSGQSGVAWYPNSSMSNANTARVVYNGAYLHGNTGKEFASVFTHEFGHFFNLIHTFQGGCTATNDEVDDTPAEDKDVVGANCSPTKNCNGEFINYENYMGYNGAADGCYRMFTKGQTDRMLAALQHPARKTLWQDQNLIDTGVNNTGGTIALNNNTVKELVTNDGSFNQEITVTLDNTTFNTSSGNLTQGNQYSIALPQGLSSTVAITSTTTATLTISGIATNHLETNNETVNLSFDTSAFSPGQTLSCTSIGLDFKFYSPYEIIYHDITDISATTGAIWDNLNLTKINGSNAYGTWAYKTGQLKLETYGKRLVTNTGTRDITLLTKNTLISTVSNFTAPEAYPGQLDMSYDTYTDWDGKTGYIGFEADHNGETIHGWMKASVSTDGETLTVYEYAFSTQPSGDILAGQTLFDTSASELLFVSKEIKEATDNTGAFNYSTKITLSGTAEFSNKTFVKGTDFTTNFPSDFTVAFNYISKDELEVTVTGTTTNHAIADNSNYNISLNSSAFTNGFNSIVNKTNIFNVVFRDPYEIIYDDIADITATTGSGWDNLNLTKINGNHEYGTWLFEAGKLKLETYGKRLVTNTGTRDISFLPKNTVISKTDNFTAPTAYPGQLDMSYDTYTDWDGKTGYLGFEAEHNGEIIHGWMKASVSTDGETLTVYEYAFSTEPKGDIKAGQKLFDLDASELILTSNEARETTDNEGSFNFSTTITIDGVANLTNKTFVKGTDFTTNFPSEFNVEINYISAKEAQVTIIGTTISHAKSDSNNYNIAFNSSAFTSGFDKVQNKENNITLKYRDPYEIIFVDNADLSANKANNWFNFNLTKIDGPHFYGIWAHTDKDTQKEYLKFETYGKRLVTNNGTRNITFLPQNTLISTASNFTAPEAYPGQLDMRHETYTDWDGKTGYIGFEAVHNGETVHGWIKANISADGKTFTVYEYAFSTQPNGDIEAGQLVFRGNNSDLEFSSKTVSENEENTGIINFTSTIRIGGVAKFTDKTFVNGADYTSTIPNDYNVEIIYLNEKEVRLTITGTLSNHGNDATANYDITFNSTAFSNGYTEINNKVNTLKFKFSDPYQIITGTLNASTPWGPFNLYDLDADNSNQSFGAWKSGDDLKIENNGKKIILNGSTDNITLINENQLISENDNFSLGISKPNIYTPSYTEWAGKTGYVGFESLYQGATVYGWFKVTVLADGSQYSITEYAFYTKPKGAILAGATTLPTKITWSGTTSSDWSNTNNWVGNIIPTSVDDVIIPPNASNFPTLTQEVTVNKITIESGATLITNSKLNANVTYNRNLETDNWYLVSSPLSNETLANIILNNNFASGTSKNIGLAPYKNDGTAWDYQTTAATGNIVSGKGYSVKLKASANFKFTGDVNYQTVKSPVTTGTNNYNLVGNPYTSYINLEEFFNANPLNTVVKEATVWLWNQATNSYDLKLAGIDNNFQIAPAQGFFVSANVNTNVTFDKNNQSHTAGTFQRQANTKTQINITATSSKGTAKTAKIYYLNGATTGFDNGFDGSVFKGSKSNFSVFTKLVNKQNTTDYAVQSLPIADLATTIVPVGIKANTNQTIIFSAESFNLPANTSVFLEDKENNKFINLSKEDYSVTLKKTTNSGQFFIHTTSKKVSNEAQILSDISISQSATNQLTITGLQSEKNTIVIYSVIGKQLLSKTFKSNGTTIINLPKVSAGVYIVNLTSDLKKVNKKIILN
ncbi:M43 family zinc metalloprotease [Tenacibaculum dicentrarchi]|uniref:M43 family zinc metalloprotease n=1 Tax=Tenacibaculum dicentrarchi TaxID=669041 RepID=UPI000C7A957C|nr:Protein of unknown function precursor containing a C-terminal secretion signal. Putative peptidase M43 family [Tenacibaculum dicentrarchi]